LAARSNTFRGWQLSRQPSCAQNTDRKITTQDSAESSPSATVPATHPVRRERCAELPASGDREHQRANQERSAGGPEQSTTHLTRGQPVTVTEGAGRELR